MMLLFDRFYRHLPHRTDVISRTEIFEIFIPNRRSRQRRRKKKHLTDSFGRNQMMMSIIIKNTKKTAIDFFL